MSESPVPLSGSHRRPLPGARSLGPADPEERIAFTLHLRPRKAVDVNADGPLSPEAFAKAHGAKPEDIEALVDFAQGHHLDVVEIRAAERSLRLSGRIADVNGAFEVELQRFAHPKGEYRGRQGVLSMPPRLAKLVTAITGLTTHAVARTLLARPQAQPRAGGQSYLPTDLAKIYRFPKGTGKGQCIAIIELAGDGPDRAGYRLADIQAYFKKRLGLTPPVIRAISVGAHNTPAGDPNSADGEVSLDIEVAGAIAPQATLAVYFAPNTDDGFLNAIKRAIHDPHYAPSALSISWGGAEASWTEQALKEYDLTFQDAAVLGVTVLAAAGDDGAADAVKDGRLHVDFPASSPHVLACGGTRLKATVKGGIASETVWQTNGATGGGVSDFFDPPGYQKGLAIRSANPGHRAGRIVPDLSAVGDPGTGFEVSVDGSDDVIGGTSAVAPLYAGLVALMNEQLGQRVGFLQPKLYAMPKTVFRDVTEGGNHGYKAGPGFDAASGFGSIDGQALMSQLAKAKSKRKT